MVLRVLRILLFIRVTGESDGRRRSERGGRRRWLLLLLMVMTVDGVGREGDGETQRAVGGAGAATSMPLRRVGVVAGRFLAVVLVVVFALVLRSVVARVQGGRGCGGGASAGIGRGHSSGDLRSGGVGPRDKGFFCWCEGEPWHALESNSIHWLERKKVVC